MSVDVIRREIRRALAGTRAAFRGVLQAYRHRAQGAVLVRAEGVPGETLPDIELIQQAGVAAGLPAGTQVIVLPLGGRTTHSIVIASEYGAYRVQVGVGEVALHHLTEPDCHVHLKAGRVVAVRGRRIEMQADEEIVLKAPVVTSDAETTHATGQAAVDGLLTGTGGIAFSGGAGGSVGTIDGSIAVTGDAEIGGKSFLSHDHPHAGGPPV